MLMAAKAVAMLHAAFVMWVVLTPWLCSLPQVFLHLVVCLFLLGHWMLDNTTCALTLLEKSLRGLDGDDESFIHGVVAPVFRVSDAKLRVWVRWATVALMSVSVYRLHKAGWPLPWAS